MPRMGITAYDLLISCPGDVVQFVDVIRECVDNFNRTIGKVNNAEIVARHWSTDSYPQSGDRAQELLNKQFVRDCDAAVALFWTKFGTPTDKYGSGTEEEIEEMLSAGKQVFMYFLNMPVDPSTIDIKQYEKVKDFKKKYEDGNERRGIYAVVKDENELRKEFTNHLAMHFLPLFVGEKVQFEKKVVPILKVKDATLMSDDQAVVRNSNFSDCKLVNEKKKEIITEISLLQTDYLPFRDKKEHENKKESSIVNSDLKELLANVKLSSLDEDIPETWRSTITEFAVENSIVLEPQFWNVGNLKKATTLVVPYLGGGSKLDGNEEEIKRYEAMRELYWKILEYREYKEFFKYIDQQNFVDFVVTNIGKTFDEDIDVKLIIKRGCVITQKEIPIPGINIMEDILKMNFLEYVYEIEASDTIDSYTDNQFQTSYVNYKSPNIYINRTAQDEYEDQQEEYEDELERIFCYQHFIKNEQDIFVFHISYLKHNTSVAFPSVLVFKEVPEFIEYEITSKFVPEVIKGKIKIVRENKN